MPSRGPAAATKNGNGNLIGPQLPPSAQAAVLLQQLDSVPTAVTDDVASVVRQFCPNLLRDQRFSYMPLLRIDIDGEGQSIADFIHLNQGAFDHWYGLNYNVLKLQAETRTPGSPRCIFVPKSVIDAIKQSLGQAKANSSTKP